jgi:Flp pilus assembly protein TadG
MSSRKHHRRRGAAVVEMALIGSLLFLLLFGIVMGGLGVFRYVQVASLAERGARWAAVHSRDESGKARKLTSADVTTVVQSQAAGMDRQALRCNAEWDSDRNHVTVTVEYDFVPECYWRTMTFSRKSIYFIPK